jgi:hypothetical protein
MNDAQFLNAVGNAMVSVGLAGAVLWLAKGLSGGNTVSCARCRRYFNPADVKAGSIMPLCQACDRALAAKGDA